MTGRSKEFCLKNDMIREFCLKKRQSMPNKIVWLFLDNFVYKTIYFLDTIFGKMVVYIKQNLEYNIRNNFFRKR